MDEKIKAWCEHATAVIAKCEDPADYFTMVSLALVMLDELAEKRGVEEMIFRIGLQEDNAASMFQLWEELNEIISKKEGS